MLPDRLYTARQCRDLDLLTIKSGVSGYELMCRAGAAALALLLQSWPRPAFIHVVCGTGNNGGDGLVLARLARQQALPVMVYLAGDPAQLHGEALQAWQDALAADVPVCTADTGGQWSAGIVVDALLGIGLQGAVRDSAAATIDRINNSGLPVLALDVPSGICADSGKVLGCAVRASKTITFIAAKRGLYTGAAVDYSGDIVVAGLSVPEAFHAQVGATVDCLDLAALQACLPVRPRSAHKGLYGHVLVVGGNHGMAGAALMAATAAARTGAGLVSVATRPAHVAAYIARQPEIMVHAVDYRHELQALLERASVVVIGPGLGQDAWAEQMLAAAIACGKPLVLDADALNLLSRQPGTRFEQACVLTPHPGEAARLLGSSNEQVNADRFLAAAQLAQHYQAVVLLKGAGSVIAACGELSLCPYGNAGMASGGMGDVLAGVIAGLMAQGLAVSTAVQLAVLVHARAADVLAQQHGQRGLLASDLIPQIRQLLNAA